MSYLLSLPFPQSRLCLSWFMTLFYGEHFSVASENGAWERRTFFETLQVYSSFPDKTNSLAELKKKKNLGSVLGYSF